MAIDYAKLKIDDAAGHPVTGPFSADLDLAKAEWNAQNLTGEGGLLEMLSHLLNKKHKTAQESTFTPILGRLMHIARCNVGDDPLGRGTGGLLLQHIHACQTFALLFRSPHLTETDFSDANLPYGFVEASGAWSTSHTADLKALSENRHSYAHEKGYSIIDTIDLTIARAS